MLIMCVVLEVEKWMLEIEIIKSYVGLVGEFDFQKGMVSMIFGVGYKVDIIVVLVIVGGIGVICQVLELVCMVNFDLWVFVSDLIWFNYIIIMNFMGVVQVSYCYFDNVSCLVDFDVMKVDILVVKKGDVVLLYGCCYNLIGVNLMLE